MSSSLLPRTSSPLRRGLAASAVPALAAVLLAPGLAVAATTVPAPYIVRNAAASATVTSPAGATHRLASPLRAAAADGSVQVVTAAVTPSRRASVAVDAGTGTALILGPSADTPGTVAYAGGGALVLRQGSAFTLVDVATGERTPLADVPAATGATRTVTAVAATADGALVATADVTEPGSSGRLDAATLWRLTAGSAVPLTELAGVHVPALAATGDRVDALLVDVATDALAHLQVTPSGTTTTPVAVALPLDVITSDLGYAEDGTTPVLSLTTATGVRVTGLDGGPIGSYPAGTRLFLSATDVTDPRATSNPLVSTVRLTGVRDGAVLDHGATVRPTTAATASGALPASPTPSTLTLRQGARRTALDSGDRVTLTRNGCFTAAAPATLFTTAATPVVACVSVEHRLRLRSFDARRRAAVVETTADRVQVQVQRTGRWVTRRTVEARAGVVRFTAPRGAVRVLAKADDAHAATTLRVTAR